MYEHEYFYEYDHEHAYEHEHAYACLNSFIIADFNNAGTDDEAYNYAE